KGYGELIRNIKEGNIEEISPTDEITKALFNIDMDAEGSNSVRSRQKTEAEDKEASNIYKAGSVVVFKNLKKNKFGIMIIRSVNVDFDAVKATNDANATITFDLYYQRY
ncbi:DNA-binding protein, partial [Bacteroides ovatus]